MFPGLLPEEKARVVDAKHGSVIAGSGRAETYSALLAIREQYDGNGFSLPEARDALLELSHRNSAHMTT